MFVCIESTFIRVGDKKSKRLANCICQCGNRFITELYAIKSGHTKSCGCYHRECARKLSRTHGQSQSGTYGIWRAMKARCNNPNNKKFSIYGGRGIKVCERWLKFENFLSDMGERPKNLTIDRIDNDKGYTPDNCQWATIAEQNQNLRSNRWLEFEGKKLHLSAWAKKLEVRPSRIAWRLKMGWPLEKALSNIKRINQYK